MIQIQMNQSSALIPIPTLNLYTTNVHDHLYDFEEISLFERLEKMDSKWESKSRYRCDEMFSKECGSNVPDYATSPLDLFFCLVSNDFLDHLVIQTNIYIKQHKKKFPNKRGIIKIFRNKYPYG